MFILHIKVSLNLKELFDISYGIKKLLRITGVTEISSKETDRCRFLCITDVYLNFLNFAGLNFRNSEYRKYETEKITLQSTL